MSQRVLFFALLLLAAGGARAEQPESSGHFTLPLPSAELADGVLTVKVVGSSMRDLRVGQPVQLHRVTDSGLSLEQTVPTAQNGRARFEGLKPGTTYLVTVQIDGQQMRSRPFAPPARGGVRLLLTLGRVKVDSRLPEDHPPLGAMGGMGGTGGTGGMGGMGDQQPTMERKEQGAAVIEPVKDLKRGALQVMVIMGRDKKPRAGITATLIQQQKELASGVTDETGQAMLALPADAGKGVVVQVIHDEQILRSGELAPPQEGGLRATFVVYDRTKDPSVLVLGQGSHWVAQLAEGVIRFMQVMMLQHRDRNAIVDPGSEGFQIPLPAGAQNVELPEDSARLATLDSARNALRLMAQVPPEGLQLRVFYQLPYQGEAVDFSQRLSLDSPRSMISLVHGARVSLQGPSIEGRPEEHQGDAAGMIFLVQAAAAGSLVEFTFANLPRRDRTMLVGALVLTGLIVLWGLLGALTGGQRARQRQAQKERLIQQLMHFKRNRGQGRENRGNRRRQQELMRELKQIWEEPW